MHATCNPFFEKMHACPQIFTSTPCNTAHAEHFGNMRAFLTHFLRFRRFSAHFSPFCVFLHFPFSRSLDAMHNQKCVSLAIFHSYLHASARIFHAAAIDFNKSVFRYLYQFPKMPYLHFSLLQTAKQRDNLYPSKQIPHENQSDGTRENVPRRSRELFLEGQRSRERKTSMIWGLSK